MVSPVCRPCRSCQFQRLKEPGLPPVTRNRQCVCERTQPGIEHTLVVLIRAPPNLASRSGSKRTLISGHSTPVINK
ncbi:hypothetical protein PHET_10630 [Paragonimus heterotremus]|uniref:Uncharacterized protein n=1 Tax=Paragonimus heterotremus TaxID=100268 RepID=A0A8J4SR59_9TREM|nr:hypothetical protein PHET_10630 [Paragonimus heterotremus]